MFTNNYRDTCLTNIGAFIGLLTAISNWRAGTVTETNYTGYSATRPGANWGTIGDMTPAYGRQKANSSAVTFNQNGGGTVSMMAFGVYSASSAGNLHAIGLLDTDVPLFGTVDTTQVGTDVITVPAHGLSAEQRVFVLAAPGAPIPGGISENTDYYIKGTPPSTDSFQLATTTPNGTLVGISGAGAALFCPHTLVPVANLATPEFAPGALIVQI